MPGAKRRALKKLLTPSQNPAHFHSNGMTASRPFEVSPSITPPPTLSYSPTDPHADPYALDTSQSQAEAQDAKILDDMEARKHVMGSAQSVHSIGNTSAPETSATGVPPNHTSLSPPPMADRTVHKSASAPAAVKGTITLTADDLIDANENGNGKGKKKSSKQRFLEREVRIFPIFVITILLGYREGRPVGSSFLPSSLPPFLTFLQSSCIPHSTGSKEGRTTQCGTPTRSS